MASSAVMLMQQIGVDLQLIRVQQYSAPASLVDDITENKHLQE